MLSQHYITTEDAQGFSNRVWFDDVVVSTKKIGCEDTPIIKTLSPHRKNRISIRIHRVSKGNIQFNVTLEKAGPFTFEVYDLSGKKLWKQRQMNAGKGVNPLHWNLKNSTPRLIIAVLKHAEKSHRRLFIVY